MKIVCTFTNTCWDVKLYTEIGEESIYAVKTEFGLSVHLNNIDTCASNNLARTVMLSALAVSYRAACASGLYSSFPEYIKLQQHRHTLTKFTSKLFDKYTKLLMIIINSFL